MMKRMKMNLLKNEKGSILQIVLVLFLVLTFSLTVGLTLINFQSQNYQQIQYLMKQKNLEILLVQEYVKEIQDGFIFRSSYHQGEYDVENQIDDMADYYLIFTRVEMKKIRYTFVVEIEKDTGVLKKLSYEE